MTLEPLAKSFPSPAQILSDLSPQLVANAFVAFIFAASGPVAILLAVGRGGGLGDAELASWVFGAFAINGLISVLMCVVYRQPLVFFWTIPGIVLVGPALEHLTFDQVVGAYLVTGLLMALLGVTGWVRKVMALFPTPIVMVDDFVAGTRDPARTQAALADQVPLDRIGTPEEVAGMAVYLASDEAAFVTGAEMVLDGGLTAQ